MKARKPGGPALKQRSCIYCSCTDSNACVLAVKDMSPREREILRFMAGDYAADLELVGCRWISLNPPVCSAPACVRKHQLPARGKELRAHSPL